MSKNFKEKQLCSTDEEMLMWTSYRYCIGRHTYVNALSTYIASKYYDKLTDNRLQFTANDIRGCIADVLRFNKPAFTYEGSVNTNERNALVDYLKWLNDNINDEKDLINIKEINCYKKDYKINTPKSFEIIKSERFQYCHSELEINDLINWETLASFFDKKNYKTITINNNGVEEDIIAFITWTNELIQIEEKNGMIYYQRKPWKFKQVYISVEQFKMGNYNTYINEDMIINIKE